MITQEMKIKIVQLSVQEDMAVNQSRLMTALDTAQMDEWGGGALLKTAPQRDQALAAEINLGEVIADLSRRTDY